MASACMLEADSVAVISDTHVGAGNSVLDEDPPGGREALRRFLGEAGVRADVFVLLGDIFELTLATYDETVRSARALVSVLLDFCDRIVFVPGNHDHHLWQMVSEENEVLRVFPDIAAEVPRAERHYPSSFLTRLTDGRARELSVCYPNAYWQPPRRPDGVYVFHHGHFCQDTYRLLGDIYASAFGVQPGGLEALEAVNAGWLELVWYHLGQSSAGLGANGLLEQLYEDLRRGHSEQLEAAIDRFYRVRISPFLHAALEKWADESRLVWRGLAARLARQLDRKAPGVIKRLLFDKAEHAPPGASAMRNRGLDDALAKKCWEYLGGVRASCPDLRDRPLSLVFGHTHRPGHWPEARPHLFNDGGWVRGHRQEWPSACVLVIDGEGTLRSLAFGPRGRLEAPAAGHAFAPAMAPGRALPDVAIG